MSLRLLPFLFLLYVINLIDRTNIGIARLQMVDQQHLLDEEAYALGAGIFYVGYLLFEVPSNLILVRTGGTRVDRAHPGELGPDLRGHDVRDRAVEFRHACACCSASPRPASFPASSTT